MSVPADDPTFRDVEKTIVEFLKENHVDTENCNGDWLAYDRDGGYEALFSATSMAIAIVERLSGKR